ncbi:neural cell adhesion molecule 1-like isoform X2 [Oscarella lobularis]|uniref:neural cell adhesion molecule 1-like isoform X2 n=1 Tax=Oscarella lobularis TaxID=121494 RepID=UPI0033139D44
MKRYVIQLLICLAVEAGSAAVQLLLRSSRLPFPGQSASFSCSGSGTIIRWEKDNTVLNLTNARYSSDQKMSSLVIHSLVKTDTGLYRCVAVVSGIEESDTVYLSVLVNPEISYKPLTVAVEGHSVTLGCQTRYFTKISWTFNGVNISHKPGYIYSRAKMNLTIDRVSRTHAGQYACTATNYNKAHTSTGTPVLVVYYGPDAVLRGPVNGTAIEGEDVIMHLNTTGFPSPQKKWKKDDVFLELESSRYNLGPDGQTLSISSVQTSDSGNYTCVVNNTVGETLEYFQLTVEGPPSPPRLLEANITVMETFIKMFVKWTVPFNGNSPITEYTLHYRQKGGAFWFTMLVRSSQVSADVPMSINLNSLKGFDFYVTASNRHGSSEESEIFQVSKNSFLLIAPPTSSSEPTEKSGLSESRVIVIAVSGFATSILTTFALIVLAYKRQRWAPPHHQEEQNATVRMFDARSDSFAESSHPSKETQDEDVQQY